MTLVRSTLWPSDPFSEMDRIFNTAFGNRNLWFDAGETPFAGGFPVDVYHDDDGYRVVAELPGFAKEDISLKMEDGILTMLASRSVGEGEKKENREVSRQIRIGDDVNHEGVKANLENGLLRIWLPKAEERKPRKIEID